MYKIAVMGDRDSIYGFAAVGLDVFSPADSDEAARKLRDLSEHNYAVVYITEALVEQIPHEIERYKEQRLPAIIPIPGVWGNTGIGISSVKKFVEQAVGSDIIFGGG